MSDHYTNDLTPDHEGWYRGICNCGSDLGIFPSPEDACDALMDHAYAAGRADGYTAALVAAHALRVRAAAADQLADALRPFAEKWDLHAADYLADLIDGKEMRIVEASQIEEMNMDIVHARNALAAYDAATKGDA